MTDPPPLADFSDIDRAIVAVQDPATPPQDLVAIAYAQPLLGASVARHPRVVPELLDWLDQYGNDQARAAVADQVAAGADRLGATASPPAITRPGSGDPPEPDSHPALPGGAGAIVAGLLFLVGALLGVFVVVFGLINSNHWGDCIAPGASAVVSDGSFLDLCFGQSSSAQWGWLPLAWSGGGFVSQLLAVWLNTPAGNVVLPGLGAVFLAVVAVLCLTGRRRDLTKLRLQVADCLIAATALLTVINLADLPRVIVSWQAPVGMAGVAASQTAGLGIVLLGRAAWILLAVWLIRSAPGRRRAGFIVVTVIVVILPLVSDLVEVAFVGGGLSAFSWSLLSRLAWLWLTASIGSLAFLPAVLIVALKRPRRADVVT